MRIIQKELLEKFKEIALKHNVPIKTVMEIEGSIWKYTVHELTSGVKGVFDTFKNIYIRHLGTFYLHKGIFDGINKRAKKYDKSTRNI